MTYRYHGSHNRPISAYRAAGAFTLDVIARTGFGIAVNSQRDKNDEFYVNAKKALNLKITNPLLVLGGKFSTAGYDSETMIK